MTLSFVLSRFFAAVLRSRKISFGSGATEPQIRISAPAPAPASAPGPAPALDSFIRYLENYLFKLSNRIKIVPNFKNFFSNRDFFYKISVSLWKIERSRSCNSYGNFGSGSGRQVNFGSSARLRLHNTAFRIWEVQYS